MSKSIQPLARSLRRLAATVSFDSVRPELAICVIEPRMRSTSAFRVATQASTAASPAMPTHLPKPEHLHFSRRTAIQAGAIGLLNLGMNHVAGLRALADQPVTPKAKSVIYIFLSGGLAQQDSFDLKPEAPDTIRGEFKPIATRTPGIQICEHLPRLAERSEMWALVRSLAHSHPDHSAGHLLMLSGRSELSFGFDGTKPKSSDWPSMAAVARQQA